MSDQLSNDLQSLRIDHDAPAPDSGLLKKLLWPAVIVAGLALVATLAGPRLFGAIFRTEVELTQIALISPSVGSTLVTSTGYVQPLVHSKVGAKIPGRVARVHVREGQMVEAGQPLVELESADQRSSLLAARSRVAAAKARAAAAQATLSKAAIELEREQKLAKGGVSSSSALENAEANHTSLKEQAAAAEAEVLAAEAEAQAIAVGLGYLTITAPITGRVVTRPPDVGERVLEEPVLEIVDPTSLVVEADVPESRLSLVAVGAPAEIILDAFPSERRRGEVVEQSAKVNRSKATVAVKVKFSDGAERVLPEMAARVSILQKALEADAMKEPPKLVVPKAAVTDRAGAKVVFVVEGDVVRMKPVVLGAPFGDGFELKSGPAAGSKVVRDPSSELSDGQKIKERAS